MAREDVAVNTIIGKGATFDGLLEITGGLRVDGTVKGKIVSDVVMVGPTGSVDADIEAKETIIGGVVKGNIKAPDKVEMQAKSQVEGDVITYSLVVEQGAVFHGNCQMKKSAGASGKTVPSAIPSAGGKPEPDMLITPKSTDSTYQKAKA